ncbi:AI-2E family transporter [Noviherbaspirillum aridicola]|uniref:AI-2E family transporter n=1 Tax=Noviherbaspirillum aridicola TaxID=2849687 RepID=A0ABQ4PZ05_9BURK|nr:AI-2E family transporter [Noviherbaspirillum aridicola]GIZ50130.1 AI-2E family transporter [Noviherbaspirillum aridicola]
MNQREDAPRAARERDDADAVDARRVMHRTVLFDTVSLLFVLAASVIWLAPEVLLLIFACVLMAILLYDVSARLRGWLGLPNWAALTIVVVLLLALIVGGGWLMAPQISRQSSELAEAVPQALQELRDTLSRYPMLESLSSGMPAGEQMTKQLGSLLPRAGLVFSGVLGVLGNVAIIAFVGVYLAAQPRPYINGIVILVPTRRRERAREVLDELGRTLGQWLAGKALSMLIVGIVTTAGLALLGVPLALVLGIIAGLLDFIPYVGPIVAGVPAVLIAFTESPALAGSVALLFLAIQIGEGYLLMPLIERRTVSLPPAVTIVVQVLMGALFGMAGVALATPLAAVGAVLITMLYVQDVLGDRVPTPSQKD